MVYQESSHCVKRPTYTDTILIVAGVGMLLSCADLITTKITIARGGTELNPFMVNLISNEIAFFVLRGMALALICMSLWMIQHQPQEEKNLKRYFPYLAFVLISPWLIAVLSNLCVLWGMP